MAKKEQGPLTGNKVLDIFLGLPNEALAVLQCEIKLKEKEQFAQVVQTSSQSAQMEKFSN